MDVRPRIQYLPNDMLIKMVPHLRGQEVVSLSMTCQPLYSVLDLPPEPALLKPNPLRIKLADFINMQAHRIANDQKEKMQVWSSFVPRSSFMPKMQGSVLPSAAGRQPRTTGV